MKKWDFIKLVANKVGLSQQQVNEVIDEMGNVIVEQCRDNGETISLPTLGTFKQKVNAARKGRNPLTGETIDVKGSKTIIFRPMPSVKVVDEPEKKTAKKAAKK